jgi:Ca-activated chloride channel family protein
MHFSFEYPIFLTLLPLVVCFFYCKKNKNIFYIPKLEYIHQSTKRINLYTILKIITFLLLVFALSSPFLYKSISPDKRDGRAIVLTLDTSGSMRESGFGGSKKSKFDIVLDLASNFIDKRVSDNIGIVAFGTFSFIS